MAAVAAVAQVPDYFPLEVGNVWIYRGRGGGSTTVEVTRRETFQGRAYYLLNEYRRGAYWVRNAGDGRVYQYDEAAGAESLWYDFSRRAGEEYTTGLPTCCGRALVVGTAESKKVALGQFEKVFFRLTYPGVFQLGITEEDFLPYVGIVFRSENTGGPSFREQDLVYAKISGVTVLNASGIGFGVARAAGYARIFVNNNTGAPLRLLFDGFVYDLTLRDEAGLQIYRWSFGKLPPRGPQELILVPGETSWVVEWPAEYDKAATLTAELLTQGRRFTATLPLQTGSSSRP